MKRLFSILALGAFLVSCGPAEPTTNDFGIVTLLGDDTLALENVSMGQSYVEAEVILRSPEVRKGKYRLDFSGERVTGMEVEWHRNGELVSSESYSIDGDSLRWNYSAGERTRSGAQENREGLLPFIDMVHWPFEIMLNRLGQDTSDYTVFSGSRNFDFKVWRKGDNEVIIKHPTRGEMDVITNAEGQLVSLNAARTTRALDVVRTDTLDLAALENYYLEVEASGKRFGAMSGRGSGEFMVDEATISLDFGTPMKRGRDIWGGLVKFGKLWRTGANRATHFTTDNDLAIGDLMVPAGEYTLFSIPDESQLTLIINKQTGQNGQQYDETRDLGRVSMTYREVEEEIEPFTIDVSEEDANYLLRLRWDRGEYIIPIRAISKN